MKFLYLYCSHIKGTNPGNRRGNYFNDIKEKFAEIIRIGKEKDVDVIYHGGDFGDAPMMSLGLVDSIVDMIEHGGITWDIIRGNHDEIGHNPNLSGESILDHIFRRSKMIRHLEIVQDRNVYIQGFDYYHGIEKDIKEKGLQSANGATGQKKIAIIHAFITPDKWLPHVLHIPVAELKSDFDLVLVAHNHVEWGIKKIDKTTFVSIGSLSRLTVAKSDTERMPNVLYVDTDVPTLQVIPLECAKPAVEIFDLDKIKSGKEFEASIENFISSLENVKFQGLNLRANIEEIGRQMGYDDEVIKEVVDRMGTFEQ